MDYKICCFFGHREMDFNPDLAHKVREKLEKLITEENYGVFKFGGYSAFDYGCLDVVKELKLKYPHIKTVLCLWDGSAPPRWADRKNYDETEFLPLDFDYWYTRLYYRNKAMIDTSHFCVFYVCKTENSGAYKAMKYAVLKKRPFINFGEIKSGKPQTLNLGNLQK